MVNASWSRSLVALPMVMCFLAGSARAQFGDLIKRVPDRANTLALLNVDQLQDSPLAQKEGWRESYERQFSAGLVLLPPQTSKFVMAAQMDFENVHPVWEMGLLDLKYEPDIPRIAAEFGGTVDNIADRSAALLPDDIYVVKFGPRFAGIAAPANRQNVAHWINSVYSNSIPPLSDYLKEAVGYAEGGTPIIMAMDVTNVFSSARLRQRLEGLTALETQTADVDKVVEVLASMRGVMLGVTVRDAMFGSIKVDFEQDATVLQEIAKPLLLEILAKRGAMIDEFKTWAVKVEGTRITFSGALYDSGMRRILSVLDAPPGLLPAKPAGEEDPEASEEKAMALASMQYFKSIGSMLDDLRGDYKTDKYVSWGQIGMWFEKYARKIDRMPILNVDPELLDYGKFVADSMRDAENSMKGIGRSTEYRRTQLPNYYNTQSRAAVGVSRWGVAGTYGYRSQEDLAARGQAEAQVRTQERIKGNLSASRTMQGVEEATAAVRRTMTEKYQMEF